MKRINSLSDLLMQELADLLSAENQLVELLPKMLKASQSPALRSSLEAHLEVSNEHTRRLHYLFNNIGQNPSGFTSKVIKKIITDSESVVNDVEKSQDQDAAIIRLAQRMEQYEIDEYKIACRHATDLGHTGIVELLNEILDEERAMNFQLNEMAQNMINAKASETKAGGYYMPEGKFKRGGTQKSSKNIEEFRFIDEGNPNIQGA